MPQEAESKLGLGKWIENRSRTRDVPPPIPKPVMVVTLLVPGAWS